MTIRGIENMSLAEVEQALQKGGCFVFYEVCISFVVISLRRPTDIYFLPPPAPGLTRRFITYFLLFVLVLFGFVGAALAPPPVSAVSLGIAIVPGVWLLATFAWWTWKTCRDGTWRDATGLKRGLVYSWVSLLLGWWGVPWGLIYTPLTIFTNLSGGQDVTDEVWALLQASAQ